MNDFSPYLAEKFVWKFNKDWLVKVPCFALITERLATKRNYWHGKLPREGRPCDAAGVLRP